MKIILFLLCFSIYAFAINTGELSFFLLKDGKALKNQNVLIFKKANNINTSSESYNKHTEFKTDNDGYIYAVLPTGKYQLQLVAKEKHLPQAYIRKNFMIKKDNESQIIVSLNKDNSIKFEDDEAPKIIKSDTNTSSNELLKNGYIQLIISSSEKKELIEDARVFVKGLSIDTKSDKKGSVLIKIPVGERTISIIHSDFSSVTIKVNVIANETKTQLVELTPAAMELEEFVVLAPQIEGSVASLTAQKKDSSAVVDVLGSEQISQKGDSNAAAALKRIAGITLVDGKNIYVRGLGERYATVELNSMPIPSPNPYKRVVELDIFPASVISSLNVQKTHSSDLPGSFAGGYIDIKTKSDVSEDYVKLSIALKAHSSALDGTKGDYYQGGSTDYLGIDDGTRDIPTSILDSAKVIVGERPPSFSTYTTNLTKEEVLQMTKDLAARDIDTHKNNVPFGGKIALEFSKKIELNSEHTIGILSSYTYDQSNKSISENFYGYSIDGLGEISNEAETYGVSNKTYTQYKQNAMLNLNYNYKDTLSMKYTMLYLLDTIERTRITDGVIGSNQDLQTFYSLDWEERTLFTNQFSGSVKHHIWSDMKLDFGAQFALAKLDQPNNIKYSYIDYSGTGDNYELLTQSAQNLIYHNLTSDDNTISLYINELVEFNLFNQKNNVEFGIDFSSKTRESRSNKFYMYAANASNISDLDKGEDPDFILDEYVTNSLDDYDNSTFLVKTLFSPSDWYDADLYETGFYAKTLLNPIDEVEITFGLRYANVEQTLHEYTISEITSLVEIQDNTMTIDQLLPSFGAKYKIDDDNQIRFGYSQTYIYPDFREFSSSGYFHPDETATVVGNPNLVHTDITNYDLRYEHYFSTTESFSIAGFYKNLINPIEDVALPSTSLPIYSYTNTQNADLFGIETDIYKKLDFLHDDLDLFYISNNISYTYSDVTLSDLQTQLYTTNHRELQGLSPLVINASFGYDNEDGRIVNLSYNYMSKRLRKVGLKNGIQEYPDQYEIPPHILDFTYQEKISNSVDIKLKARNLLDGETVWEEGTNVVKEYKIGQSYEISMSYKY